MVECAGCPYCPMFRECVSPTSRRIAYNSRECNEKWEKHNQKKTPESDNIKLRIYLELAIKELEKLHKRNGWLSTEVVLKMIKDQK